MRGKIAVAVIVVLACALFLVPYASANVGITWSVCPEEADFKTEFVYSITLTNPSGGPCMGELGLIVGSDSDNMDIRREWDVTKMELEQESSCEIYGGNMIKIPAGESCTVKTRVQFTHPKLKQGAFRDWTENPKSPKWLTAWYECYFTPFPYGDKVGSDEKMGEPILTRCIEEFREHHVEQNRVYKDLSFDYSITVEANCEDSIELQVRNYSNTSPSGWDKQVLQKYTELDVETNKTLTWPAVNLTLDNFREGQGHYKFVGNINQSKIYSGPRIEERFEDPKVSYKKTINELFSFDYEVSVWIDQLKDSIKLKVYNYSLRDWEEKGIRNYTTPGIDQKLKWESINLSRDYFDGKPLRGKYRFVGKYNKSEIIGPRIEEKFYDLGVTPTQGKNNRTFNYSVTVNANIYDKIELQVKNHTTDQWDSKGTRDYTTPNINETLTWHNIQLNTHELNRHNDSRFKFKGNCGAESSEEGLPIWPIYPVFRNSSVKPERGLYSENYDYSVDVKAEKNGIVNLSIFCPDGILLHETKLDYNKAPLWQTLNWSGLNFNRCDVKTGDAGFRFGFWYNGSEIINRTKEGPYIGIAKFENEAVEPEIGTKGTLFNYTINVSAAHGGTVELLIKCPEGTHWDTGGEKKYDSTSGIRKTLTWTRIKLPCDFCGKAEYMFKFESGHVLSENYTGPEIIEEEFGELIVTPEKGTNYTPFNFSVDFTTSKPRNVTLWARYDEGVWELVESKPVASKRETILFSNITSRKVFKEIEWKCKGIVNESEINCTPWDIGLKWLNRSFSPEEGWWYEAFDFSVRVSASVPGDVVLMIKEEDSNEWMAVGNNRPYTDSPNPQTLTWENERISNNPYKGNTHYNFTFYWGKTGYADNSSYGPKLFIPLNISSLSSSVIPNDGVLYNFKDYIFSDNSNTLFNFSISVTADDNTTLKLVLFDPDGNEHLITEKECNYATPHQPFKCSWSGIELPSGQLNTWNYTFEYYDERLFYDTGYGWNMFNKTFEGPNLVAVFEEYHSSPNLEPDGITWGELVNVTVCMNGTEEMDITLEAHNVDPYSQDYNNWTEIGTEPEHYYATGKECLNWTVDTYIVPFDKLRLKW